MTPVEPDKLGPDLSAYLDGQLSPQRAAEIEALLAESPEARQLLEQLRETSQALRGLTRLDAPPELRAHLRAELVGRGAVPGGVILERRWPAMLAVAAALLLAVGGWWLLQPVHSDRSPLLAERSAPEPIVTGVRSTEQPADRAPRLARRDAPAGPRRGAAEAPAVAAVSPGAVGVEEQDAERGPELAVESRRPVVGGTGIAAASDVLSRLMQLGYAGGDEEDFEAAEEVAAADSAPAPAEPLVAVEIRPAQAEAYARAEAALGRWQQYTLARRSSDGDRRLVVELAVPPDELDDLLADFETALPQQVATRWHTPRTAGPEVESRNPVSAIGLASTRSKMRDVMRSAGADQRPLAQPAPPGGARRGRAVAMPAAVSARAMPRAAQAPPETGSSAGSRPAPRTVSQWLAQTAERFGAVWGDVLRMSLSYDTGPPVSGGESGDAAPDAPQLAPVPVRVIVFPPPKASGDHR